MCGRWVEKNNKKIIFNFNFLLLENGANLKWWKEGAEESSGRNQKAFCALQVPAGHTLPPPGPVRGGALPSYRALLVSGTCGLRMPSLRQAPWPSDRGDIIQTQDSQVFSLLQA